MGRTAVSVSPKPTESVDKLTLMRNHPLFRHLTSATLEQLAARMTKKALRRGDIIFAKGDAGVGLIGVMRGSVKISVMSAEGEDANGGSLDELRRKQILVVLEQTGWHQGKASEILGISPSTLYRQLKAYGLTRSRRLHEQAF